MVENDCCPPGAEPLADSPQSIGAKEPLRGNVTKVKDIRMYTTLPKDQNKNPIRGVVVVIHDIFGFGTSRTHHVCDDLADKGFVVFAPCFYGEELDASKGWFSSLTNPRKFTARFTYPWQKVEPKFETVMDYIKTETEYGELKVGFLGFCWGAWAGFHMAATDFFSCGVSFHPSLILTKFHGESLDKLCGDVKSPQLLVPAFPDPSIVRENGKAINILRELPFGEECKVVEMRQVNHGFMNRGDLKNKKVAQAYKDGLEEATIFFEKHLT